MLAKGAPLASDDTLEPEHARTSLTPDSRAT